MKFILTPSYSNFSSISLRENIDHFWCLSGKAGSDRSAPRLEKLLISKVLDRRPKQFQVSKRFEILLSRFQRPDKSR